MGTRDRASTAGRDRSTTVAASPPEPGVERRTGGSARRELDPDTLAALEEHQPEVTSFSFGSLLLARIHLARGERAQAAERLAAVRHTATPPIESHAAADQRKNRLRAHHAPTPPGGQDGQRGGAWMVTILTTLNTLPHWRR